MTRSRHPSSSVKSWGATGCRGPQRRRKDDQHVQVYSRAYPWVSRTRAANLLEYLSHGTTRYVTDVSKGGAHHWRLTDLGRATLERNKDVK